MPPLHNYWIKFPNEPPYRLYAKDYEEFLELLRNHIFRNRNPFEWLIRD